MTYQDEYQLMIVHTYDVFIELPSPDIQSHNPETEPTSPFPIQIMLSTCLGSDKYQFLSHWFDSTRVKKLGGPDSNQPAAFGFPDLPEQEAGTLLIRPAHLV